MPDLIFRVAATESNDPEITVDVESDLVPTEVRHEALGADSKYVDRHDDATVDDAVGETIGEGGSTAGAGRSPSTATRSVRNRMPN